MVMLKKMVICLNRKGFSTTAALLSDIYVLSAVRTPIGSVNGSLSECTVSRLGAAVLKEALQRAIVPSEDIQNVFMACSLQDGLNEELANQTLTLGGLSKRATLNSDLKCGMKSFIEGSQLLLKVGNGVCMAGGMESISTLLSNDKDEIVLRHEHQKRYMMEDYKKLRNGYRNGVFDDEIVKLIFRKKGQVLIVSQDDSLRMLESEGEKTPTVGEGAVAIVLATEDYVRENHLTPLARVLSFADGSSSSDAIKQALEKAGCQSKEINQWEFDDFFCDVDSSFTEYFNIDHSFVNKDGSAHSLGYSPGMSGARVICHLVHSLPAGQLGCAVSCNANGKSSALIIKKIGEKIPGKPQLTLYTKHPCPLCDELKEQLKPFQERFTLQEVDIEAEGNKKFKKLYRFDIPVLFLDGTFLCKHKLDLDHFQRRLIKSEKDRSFK